MIAFSYGINFFINHDTYFISMTMKKGIVVNITRKNRTRRHKSANIVTSTSLLVIDRNKDLAGYYGR